MSKANNLIEIWDTYKNSILLEKKLNKPGPGAKSLDDKANTEFQHEDSGPAKAEGVKDIADPAKKKSKIKTDDIVKFSLSDEKIDESIEKMTSDKINNYMKSIFDKLFEEVMNDQELQDAESLGVDVNEEPKGLEDGEGADENVTVTLSKDQVECLKSILSQLEGDDLGGDEGLEGDEGGLEDVDGPEGKDEPAMGEATEVEEIGHAIVDEKKLDKGMTGKNNKVGNLKVSSGKADAKVTDKVGNDGNLADAKGLGLTKGSNKVGGKISKPGQDAFAL